MEPLHFLPADVQEQPPPGWYAATIAEACWRRSSRGNRMVYLVHALEGVSPPFHRICDCFVLEGASPRGLTYARKRLVEVYRACGLSPQAGKAIHPGDLRSHQLEVEVVHESWKGRTRLKVTGYRPLETGSETLGDRGTGTGGGNP